jgi:hypothetical protein
MQRIFNDLLMGNSLFLYSDTFTMLLYCQYIHDNIWFWPSYFAVIKRGRPDGYWLVSVNGSVTIVPEMVSTHRVHILLEMKQG